MKSFLKENYVLVAGILLPVLLTLIFFTATQIGKLSTKPPEYKVIYAVNYFKNTNYPYQISVKDGKVWFSYIPPKDQNHRNWEKPTLYVFDSATDTSDEISLPEVKNPDQQITSIVDDLQSVTVNTEKKSPDGYVFERNPYRDSNLMTEVFGGGHYRRSRQALTKDSQRIFIPHTQTWNTEFIGWVVEENNDG